MSKEKITKELLLKKLGIEQERTTVLFHKDEGIRKEFAKIFVWREPQNFHRNDDFVVPSWERIFTEVGKLLAARTFLNYEGNVSELECRLNDLEQKIRKEIHPNL